jgi:hypothetical protein
LRWLGSRGLGNFSAPLTEQETAGSPLRSALKVLLQNLEPQSGELLWRKAETRALSMQDAPKVRKILRERVENMFSWLTDELSSPRWRPVEQGEPGVRIGLWGFSFEEFANKDQKDEQTASQTRTKRNKA